MKSPSCGAAVPEGKRFCVECGAPSPAPCPSCGSFNPPFAKFCGDCGAELNERAPIERLEGKPKHSTWLGERRQLTVMFIDLVGSTALAAGLDPEDMFEVLRAYQTEVTNGIMHFGGHVAKLWETGFWAISGGPKPTKTMPSGQYSLA